MRLIYQLVQEGHHAQTLDASYPTGAVDLVREAMQRMTRKVVISAHDHAARSNGSNKGARYICNS